MVALVEYGADVNARSYMGAGLPTGGSVLFWARTLLGKDHDVVKMLLDHGAKNYRPGMKDEL